MRRGGQKPPFSSKVKNFRRHDRDLLPTPFRFFTGHPTRLRLFQVCKDLSMIKDLMTTRRFAPLFWAQFFSALNDNFLKNALVILILFGAVT